VSATGKHDCKERAESDGDALGQTHALLLPVLGPLGPVVCELSIPSLGDVGGTIGRHQVGGQDGRPAYVE
jgi:hypothetical protein